MEYQQLQIGQKVTNSLGEVLTVTSQRGCQVHVEEKAYGHYHPSKLFPVDDKADAKTS